MSTMDQMPQMVQGKIKKKLYVYNIYVGWGNREKRRSKCNEMITIGESR